MDTLWLSGADPLCERSFRKAGAEKVRKGSDGTGAGTHKGNMILPRRILQRNLVVIPCGKILARSPPFLVLSSFDSPARPLPLPRAVCRLIG